MDDGIVRKHGLLELLARQRYRTDVFCHFWKGDDERDISFVELFAEAAKFRSLYAEAGITTGSVIIIATEYSPESMFAFVGALIGGFIPAFLAPLTEKQHVDLFAATIASIIQYTKPGGIVVTPGAVQRFIPPDLSTILAGSSSPASVVDAAWPTPGIDDVAFLQFSSGTTGLRKGVMLDHRAIMAQLDAFSRVVPMGEGDLVASWLPLYHDMGLIACFIMPLAYGVPLALQDPIEWARDPRRLFEAIERHRATHVWLPNFAFNHLRLVVPKSARYDLSSMKAFINCSEPCKPGTFDAFAARFGPCGAGPEKLATSYAMAEAVFAVTQSPVGHSPARLEVDRETLQAEQRLVAAASGSGGMTLLSAGELLPGIEMRVFDASLQPLPEGQIGQIALAGPFVFHGYYNNPEASGLAFHEGWFLTGDLGAVHHGQVYITGRLKDIIIVNGKNFYAHDIEECVSRVADVRPGRVAAFAIDNEIVGSEEVVVTAETTLDRQEYRLLSRKIKQALIETLGLTAVRPYPVPPGWIVKTTSGKTSRKENRERYLSAKNQPSPASPVELSHADPAATEREIS